MNELINWVHVCVRDDDSLTTSPTRKFSQDSSQSALRASVRKKRFGPSYTRLRTYPSPRHADPLPQIPAERPLAELEAPEEGAYVGVGVYGGVCVFA